MNVLIINSVASYGSTGSIALSFYKYLNEHGHETKLCYGRGTSCDDDNIVLLQNKTNFYYHVFMSRIFGNQGFYSNNSTRKLIKIIKKNKPDVIYLMNIHGYYLNYIKLFNFLIAEDIPVVYVMFDEYAMTGKCCFTLGCTKYKTECDQCPQVHEYPNSYFIDKSKKIFNDKNEIYKQFERIVFVSVPYTINKAKSSKLLSNKKLLQLDEGIDLINTYYPRKSTDLKNKLKISDDKVIILNVAPFSNPRKGAVYFLEAARLLEEDDKFLFIHVGFDVDIKICPDNFIPISYVYDKNELAEYYSIADLFFVTSIAETIPNTAMQALACGTPICGYDIEGIPQIAPEPYGKYIEPMNVLEMVNTIKKVKKKDISMIESCRLYAKSRYCEIDYFKSLMNIGLELFKS